MKTWEEKRILSMQGLYFLLPDDFKGDTIEAVRALLTYLERTDIPAIHNDGVTDPDRGAKFYGEVCAEDWNRFVKAVEEGRRFTAVVNLTRVAGGVCVPLEM